MSIASPATRRIGLLGFAGITALDLIGPLEVFATATRIAAERAEARTACAYKTLVIGRDTRAFCAESGILSLPDTTLDRAPRLDTLIVPGGCGLREPATLATIANWIRRRRGIRRVASVCTGIYAMAEAGLLDGCRVTTHWRHAEAVARRYPRLQVDPDAIYIRHGRYYTSAGVSAGIDLALALVEEDHGPALALAVARELVVYLKRAGGQKQYSEPLAFQTGGSAALGDLATWMLDHLGEDLSVERLAQHCCLSPRQLSRRFSRAFGLSPAAYVERLRIEQAGHRLGSGHAHVDRVADALGFRSADVFRRAFERHFGIAPAHYRARLGATSRSDE